MKMQTKAMLILFLALLLLAGCSVNKTEEAAMPKPMVDSTVITQRRIDSNLQQELNNVLQEREKKLAQEAVAALEMTQSAIRALEENRGFRAIKLLEQALGKLEALMTSNPDFKLVPVDVKVDIIDLDADWDTIQATQRSVKQFVREGKYQTARTMLENLRNELHIRIFQLPMVTYPDAIKTALALIDDNKEQEAKKVLQDALKTLVMVESSVPIPLINAELMISLAGDSTQTNTNAAMALLTEAQRQIQLAEALGYADRDHEYIELNRDIESIMDKVRHKEQSQSMFDSLTSRIKKFIKRIS